MPHMISSEIFKYQARYRESFNQLAKLVFGMDFEAWYQHGCWDDRYICHAMVEGSRIIANVSVSKMDLIIHGLRKKAMQIGTVMTHPEHRGKGLSKQLMNHVLNTCADECDLIFLFANRTVLDFYPKFGFEVWTEHHFYEHLPVFSTRHGDLDKLSIFNKADQELIDQMLAARRPVSQRFGIVNHKGLFYFYMLHGFSDYLYYARAEDAIVVYEEKGDMLHLYDIISKHEVDMGAIVSRIPVTSAHHIQFHFTPDDRTEHMEIVQKGDGEDVLFVKTPTDSDLSTPFCVPTLGHT